MNACMQVSPFVSVIIPATRPDRLPWVLHALFAQQYTAGYEVIVVGTFVADVQYYWPIVAVGTAERCSPGVARELGVQQARGDVLIFLDDDCAVPTGWIEHNVLALQQQSIGAVGARIRGRSTAFFARCTDFACFGDFQPGRARDIPLATASMGVWRSVYERSGGFDTTLVTGEEEDTDLCHRIQRLGYRTRYCPEIVVLHDHQRNTLGKLLRHLYWQGRSRGLGTKVRYKNLGSRNRLLAGVRFPPLFLLFTPVIALLATLRIIVLNVREHWKILLYAPFILLGKIVYNFGIFMHLLHGTLKAKD